MPSQGNEPCSEEPLDKWNWTIQRAWVIRYNFKTVSLNSLFQAYDGGRRPTTLSHHVDSVKKPTGEIQNGNWTNQSCLSECVQLIPFLSCVL